MNTTALRIVIDTNILIAIIGKKSPYRWIFDAIVKGEIALCVTTEILYEYQEILALKNGNEVAENVINLITILPKTEKIGIFFNFNLILDGDDNKFADCAIASNAICLVSNDSHFKVLKFIPFPKVNLLTLEDFEEKYKNAIAIIP